MSKIALSPNVNGTGTFTIAAPNSNSDRTIDLPDAAGTVFVSGQAVTATTGNFSGNVTLGSSVQGNVVAVAALDIDCSLGNYFTKTISANSTFTFSNAPASHSFAFTLELTHTSGAVTWPTEVKWPSDTAPIITDGNTSLFIFVTDDGGTRWRGAALLDYVN